MVHLITRSIYFFQATCTVDMHSQSLFVLVCKMMTYVCHVTVLEQAGIDLSKPMTTMCYNGHAACLMALAASILGKEDVAVYYVSF